MPATITKYGNVIFVDDGFQTVQYWSLSSVPNSFSFDSSTNIVKSRFFRYWGMDVPLSQLTIDGVIPANEAAFDAALTTLSTLQTTGGGGGGVAGVTGDLVSGTATNPIVNLAGTLGADRTVDLDGHSLVFFKEIGEYELFRINPSSGHSLLAAYNDTNGEDHFNTAYVEMAAVDVGASASLIADFDDGTHRAVVEAAADTNGATLAYTADTHTFNGNLFQYVDIVTSEGLLNLNGALFFSQIKSSDATAESGVSLLADLVGNSVSFEVKSNTGANEVAIFGDAIAQTLAYTADAHTFNIVDLFSVTDGGNNFFTVSPSSKSMGFNVGDGTAATNLSITADGSNANFQFKAEDGSTEVEIFGDAQAQTITLTGANGLVINGTPAVTDDVAIVGLTNTYTLHFICGLYTGTTIT